MSPLLVLLEDGPKQPNSVHRFLGRIDFQSYEAVLNGIILVGVLLNGRTRQNTPNNPSKSIGHYCVLSSLIIVC